MHSTWKSDHSKRNAGAGAPARARGTAPASAPRVVASGRDGVALDRGLVMFPPHKGDEAEARRERQRAGRRMRESSARLLSDQGVAKCGQRVTGMAQVQGQNVAVLRVGTNGAHFAGVHSCHSVHVCPVCASRIAAGRQKEVQAVVGSWQQRGAVVVMVTLTQGHHAMDDPKELRQAVANRWRRLIQGKAWVAFKERSRLAGGVRVLEPTVGPNGFHPHLHVLMIFGGDGQPVLWQDLQQGMSWLLGRWCALAEREGVRVSADAQHWRIADDVTVAADYVTKWGAAWEMTHGHRKKGRGEHRTLWQVLADYQEHGKAEDGVLWKRYAAAWKGARQMTWFGDIRGMDDEQAAEAAEELEEDQSVPVVLVTADLFHALRASRPLGRGRVAGAISHLELVMRAAEVGGYQAVFDAVGFLGHDLNGLHLPEEVTYRRPPRKQVELAGDE